MKRWTMSEAIVEALRVEFLRDERVFFFGQDIGVLGGPLQSFKGLWELFGDTGRIIDAPISEEAMVAASIGAAMTGSRPVLEIMFAEFLALTMAPLAMEAGMVHYKSDSRLSVPLVVRCKFGIGPHRGHAEDSHGMLMNVPGLKLVMPSTARDAGGMMRSAIRDDNPVIFFEHMSLLHGRREELPDDLPLVPLGVADVKRRGRDLTIVATALMLHRSLKAAEKLAAEGIEAEVIDPRTISPLDSATILESVAHTGRLMIVHEAWKFGGSGGEIAAMVAEQGFSYLKAPIVRVAPQHTPVPYSLPLEKLFIPDEERIVRAARSLMA